MKNFYLLGLIISLFASAPLIGQNLVVNGDFENWTGTTADNWLADGGAIEITQNSTTVQSESFSCEVLWTSQDNQYLTSDAFNVTSGIEINASMWVYDNDIAGRARLCIIYEGADNYYGDYSSDMDEWQQITYSDIVPSGATSAQFQIRFYDISGDWDGDATVIVDNVVYDANTIVQPEPTNHVTDFVAGVSGVSISLNWTDAVGDVLPSGYLIKGSMGIVSSPNWNIPVDGVPEDNDLNWEDDGEATVNVAYGTEMFTFSNLEPGVIYFFSIFSYTNSGENIDYKTDGSIPDAMAFIENIVIINQENFDAGLGTWTPYNVIGDQEWYQDEFSGKTFAKMSGYDGASFDNEDWLISPMLNLESLDSAFFSFESAFNYDGPHIELYISNDYDGSGNPNDFSWTDISDMVAWSDGNWNFVESGELDLGEYLENGIYLAFKFTSTTAGSATWELDSFIVYGNMGIGIGEKEVVSFTIYPNPVNDVVNIDAGSEGSVKIYSLSGQLLINELIGKGVNSINVSDLNQGAYLMQFSDENGNSSTEKLLVK